MKERELATDVGSIDIELRNVVYDSYSNFIAASDIVKNLKTSLDGIDEKLLSLDSLVSDVVIQSESIDEKLSEQQNVIFQMNQSRSLLQRLTSLLRVPKTMKMAVERGAYEVAAEMYFDTKSVLEKYSDGHTVIREIRDEVEIYRCQSAEALRSRLMKSSEEASHGEIVILLAKLDEPTASLMNVYFASQTLKIKGEVEKIESAFEMRGSLTKIVDFLQSSIESIFVSLIADTVRLSKDVFDSSMFDSVVTFVQASTKIVLDTFQIGIIKKCHETLASVGGFDVAGLELEQPFSEEENLNREDILEIEYIYQLLSNLRRRSLDLDLLIPEAQSVNLLQLTVHTILDDHIKSAFVVVGGRLFKSVKEIIMKIVLNTTAEDDPNSYRFLKVHMKAIEVGIIQDFGIIRSCAMTWIVHEWMQKEWIDVILACISDSWKDTMLFLSSRMGSLGGVQSSCSLLLPGFLERQFAIPENLNVDNANIALLYLSSQLQMMRECLQGRTADLCRGISVVSPHIKESLSPAHASLITPSEVDGMVSALMEQYITSMKSRIRRSIEENQTDALGDTPTAPSAVALDIVQTVTCVDADFHNTSFDVQDSGEGIQKEFQDKASTKAIWDMLKFSAEIQKGILKTRRISKAAFQQIQIDCHMIKSRTSKYVEDKKQLSSLFDALSIAAAERCDDPILLDPIALDKALP